MAGALRKTMEYLGLAESDERFDEYDAYADDEPTPTFFAFSEMRLRRPVRS